MPHITPSFLFNTEALEAAELYISVFPNSRILHVNHYGDAGPLRAGLVLSVEFELDGQDYSAINSGATFAFNESLSFRVNCASQDEVDHYWERLSDGGKEGNCGWLTDRFGVSWQIVPMEMGRYLGDPDPVRAQRAMKAMLTMSKLDLALFDAAVNAS